MPRLCKGELASGIKLRSKASASSAEARFALMISLQKVGVVSESDAAPFKTFEALCNYRNESKGIFPISPKTLRKHISIDFVGGLQDFRRVFKWIGSATNQATEVAAEKGSAVAATPREIDAVLEMSARYADLIDRLARLAGESERARIEFRAHLRVFPESAGHLRLVK